MAYNFSLFKSFLDLEHIGVKRTHSTTMFGRLGKLISSVVSSSCGEGTGDPYQPHPPLLPRLTQTWRLSRQNRSTATRSIAWRALRGARGARRRRWWWASATPLWLASTLWPTPGPCLAPAPSQAPERFSFNARR